MYSSSYYTLCSGYLDGSFFRVPLRIRCIKKGTSYVLVPYILYLSFYVTIRVYALIEAPILRYNTDSNVV